MSNPETQDPLYRKSKRHKCDNTWTCRNCMHQRRRERRKASGNCAECRTIRDPASSQYCTSHYNQNKEDQRASYRRGLRALQPGPLVPNAPERDDTDSTATQQVDDETRESINPENTSQSPTVDFNDEVPQSPGLGAQLDPPSHNDISVPERVNDQRESSRQNQCILPEGNGTSQSVKSRLTPPECSDHKAMKTGQFVFGKKIYDEVRDLILFTPCLLAFSDIKAMSMIGLREAALSVL
ncbi:hypothetical protein F5B20DRAFT_548206 [Whalleya microplaca]|nr:hypothetical protein F5B20DRAFT_548206 [Whalleya microplaca]